jgi:hypothetical protein
MVATAINSFSIAYASSCFRLRPPICSHSFCPDEESDSFSITNRRAEMFDFTESSVRFSANRSVLRLPAVFDDTPNSLAIASRGFSFWICLPLSSVSIQYDVVFEAKCFSKVAKLCFHCSWDLVLLFALAPFSLRFISPWIQELICSKLSTIPFVIALARQNLSPPSSGSI